MNETGKSSLMNAGEHDVRNTAEEWIDIINILDDPAMVFLIADSLSNKDLVKKNNERDDEKVSFNMTSAEIVSYALERYIQLAGGIDKLFGKIREAEGADLLLLKLEAIDLVIKRMKFEELQYVHIFLNSYRDFIPWELLKIKVKEVHEVMIALEKTQQIKVLSKEITES